MLRLRHLCGSAAAVIVGASLLWACGDDALFGPGAGANSSSGGSGGSAAGGGGGYGGSSVGGFGGGQGGGSCDTVTLAADRIPLHMILAVDRSGSMEASGYWAPVVAGLKSFFQDPRSHGLFVGLNYFPAPGAESSCVVAAWNPVQVPDGAPPLASLPQDAGVLASSLDTVGSAGMTPLWGVLEGSYQFAAALLSVYPGDEVAVVLASDGQPTLCDGVHQDVPWIATNTVAPAFNDHGIETFTIAIAPSVLGELNLLAAAGNTVQAYDVSGSLGTFPQVMGQIRTAAHGCAYRIPDPGDGFQAEPIAVSLSIGGGPEEILPPVANASACSGAGWYVDPDASSRNIILCPTSCASVQQALGATAVDMVFTCAS